MDALQTIEMDRFTQFKTDFVKAPRFDDNTLLINANVGMHNKVVCGYVQDGVRMFPEPLYVAGHTARNYRPFVIKTVQGGVFKVRAVPISEFKILKISERSLHDI